MTLTLKIARELVNAAIQEGLEKGVPVAAVVVDTGGHIVAAARSEKLGFLNLDMAQRKATAAATFMAPTHGVLEMIRADAFLVDAVMQEQRISLVPGGYPIMIAGALVGGLGVAGGHYSQDQAIAEEAMKVL